MRIKRHAAVIAAALSLVGVYANSASGEGSEQHLGGERTTSPIVFTYSSSLDGGTKYTVSNGGNIVNLISPNSAGAEYDHIGPGALSEGYVLCYTKAATGAVNAYDTGSFSSGFATPVVGTNQITRNTTDGQFQLIQKFIFNAANKSLNINVTVRNIGPGSASNVIFRRQVDTDADTGGAQGWANFQNRFVTGTDFVMGYNDMSDAIAAGQTQASGVMLRHIQQPSGVTHVGKTTAAILESGCDPAPVTTPTARDDLGSTLQYNMGTIGSTGDRTVRIQYERV
jgi:hypothetical protein